MSLGINFASSVGSAVATASLGDDVLTAMEAKFDRSHAVRDPAVAADYTVGAPAPIV